MVIVKTDNKDRFGVSVCLPEVGDQTPDSNGEFEVKSLKRAERLCASQPDFYIKDSVVESDEEDDDDEEEEQIQLKSEQPQVLEPAIKEKEIENDEDIQVKEPTDEDKKAFVAELPKKLLKELQLLCKPFPGAEWRGKNKEELVVFLTEKILPTVKS